MYLWRCVICTGRRPMPDSKSGCIADRRLLRQELRHPGRTQMTMHSLRSVGSKPVSAGVARCRIRPERKRVMRRKWIGRYKLMALQQIGVVLGKKAVGGGRTLLQIYCSRIGPIY